jgi:Fe-Mn family superoxide dismutase
VSLVALPFSGILKKFEIGTKYENMSVAQIVISTAPPHESQTLAFNYASLALNNSFFLHHLVSPRTPSQNTVY